jgi:large subunit ribosomal protein L6
MSRVGKLPVKHGPGVEIKVEGQKVVVKGKLGELSQEVSSDLNVSQEEGQITLERINEEKQTRANHGLYRSLINNMVQGVTEGYEKRLELVGVGYRASHKGQRLELSLGFSHNIVFELPEETSVETVTEKGKAPLVILKSFDKQLLGAVAAKIRSFRKPEPYKGKGVRFVGEHVRSKAGKTASK